MPKGVKTSQSVADAIVDALKKGGTGHAIAHTLGVDPKTVYRVRDEAVNAGLILAPRKWARRKHKVIALPTRAPTFEETIESIVKLYEEYKTMKAQVDDLMAKLNRAENSRAAYKADYEACRARLDKMESLELRAKAANSIAVFGD